MYTAAAPAAASKEEEGGRWRKVVWED